MTITKVDLNSLIFACNLIGSVKDNTIAEKHRKNLEIHAARIRKVYLLLINCASERTFDFERACKEGVPDNSAQAKGIRTLTAAADEPFDNVT